MARAARPDLSPWKRRPLTIPPNTVEAWMRLAVWEVWMGVLIAVTVGFGVSFILTSPDKVIVISDFTGCYAPDPRLPCEIEYRTGMLNVAFTALCGCLLLGVAAWFLWELWNAVEPKPITDDFLKLLNDSFGRDWRNPLTWPWARAFYAYGFTLVGVTLTAAVAMVIWTLVVSPNVRAPTAKVTTSQSFRVP